MVGTAGMAAALVWPGRGGDDPGPASVAVGYQEAVVRGDAARLFELSGPELRRGRTRAVFVEETEAGFVATADDRGSITRVVAGTVRSNAGAATVEVQIEYVDGLGQPQSVSRAFRLRRHEGAWRVSSTGDDAAAGVSLSPSPAGPGC